MVVRVEMLVGFGIQSRRVCAEVRHGHGMWHAVACWRVAGR